MCCSLRETFTSVSSGLVKFQMLLCLSDAARMVWSQSGLFLKTSLTSQNPVTLTQKDGGRMKPNLNSWYFYLSHKSLCSVIETNLNVHSKILLFFPDIII